jgi:hypothetical protein
MKRTLLIGSLLAVIGFSLSACGDSSPKVEISSKCSNDANCVLGFDEGLVYIGDLADKGGEVTNVDDLCKSLAKNKFGNASSYSTDEMFRLVKWASGCIEGIYGFNKGSAK